MPVDSNNMEYIYPVKKNGFIYTMNNDDPVIGKHFQLGGSVTKFTDEGDGFFGVNNSNQVRLSIKKFPEAEDSIDGCNADFAEAEKRGFMYKSGDFRDVEVKMIVRVTSLDPHILIGGPTGHHPSDSSPCCQGSSYFARFQNKSPFRVQIGKEMFHHDGYESLDEKANAAVHSTRLEDSGEIGIGYIRYNSTRKDSNGNSIPSVVIESWIDSNGDGKGWKRFSREEDYKGRGWFKSGRDGTECGGVKDQPLTWGNLRVRIRWDDPDAGVGIKSLMLAEIAPGAIVTEPGGQQGGGGTPAGGGGQPTPPPQLVSGFVPITLRRHFNLIVGTICSAAGEKQIFNQQQSTGESDLDGELFQTGEVVKRTLSNLYSKKISSGTLYITKRGSGTNLKVRIRNKNNQLLRTLATITAGSIGTPDVETPVNFTSSPTNTYAMRLEDRFSIEEDGSPTTTNYMSISRSSESAYDGGSSKRYTLYDGIYREENGDIKMVLNSYD